jgi:hypothetical protein
MPCFTRQMVEVRMENKDLKTLKGALEMMGYSARMTDREVSFSGVSGGVYASGVYRDGGLSHDGGVDVRKLNQSYAAKLVEGKARKYLGGGWKMFNTSKGRPVEVGR